MTGQTAPIVEDKLFALIHPYELDGRAMSHPLEARGYSTMNCYLLTEEDGAVLFSTGYSAHQDALLAQLEALVGDRMLSLVIPRVEYVSMCNARPIADRFHVPTVFQQLPDPPSTLLNFRPEWPAGGDDDGLRDAERVAPRAGTEAPVDRAGRRRLEFHVPKLRLLSGMWAYDAETRTLFTGDMFSWTWHDSPDGPWILSAEDDDPATLERVVHFLVHNRYWWLAGAHTAPFREWLKDVFDRYDVEVVAPDHGAILTGSAVARHLQLLDDALATAATLPSIGVEAGRWPTAVSAA